MITNTVPNSTSLLSRLSNSCLLLLGKTHSVKELTQRLVGLE